MLEKYTPLNEDIEYNLIKDISNEYPVLKKTIDFDVMYNNLQKCMLKQKTKEDCNKCEEGFFALKKVKEHVQCNEDSSMLIKIHCKQIDKMHNKYIKNIPTIVDSFAHFIGDIKSALVKVMKK